MDPEDVDMTFADDADLEAHEDYMIGETIEPVDRVNVVDRADQALIDEMIEPVDRVNVVDRADQAFANKFGELIHRARRVLLRPTGCSRCRKVVGCTRSCWSKVSLS